MATLGNYLVSLQRVSNTYFIRNFLAAKQIRNLHRNAVNLSDRRYTDKHEWITLNGNVGTVGITHYAQDKLGDIVYVQMPDVGAEQRQHDECGALESVKAASEIYCPVSGTVIEINKEVEQIPGLINKSCYEKGWLFKIELSKIKEFTSLMDDKGYEQYLNQD